MKINDIKGSQTPPLDHLNKTNQQKRVGQKQFSKEMRYLDELSAKEKLEQILGRIDKQSKRLSEKVDIKELVVYKKLIKEFMNESVKNMIEYSKEGFLDRRGRHRVQAIIKKVDNELEEMTKDVLNEETDNINILKKMEDIRGLILDIYM